MEIGTIIFLENEDLQNVISYISNGLSQQDDWVEPTIGSFITRDPNNIIGKCPYSIKVILDKYRTLILQNNTNEDAIHKLVKNWNQYFDYKKNESNPYKKDFENMVKLINTGMSVFDIFIAINNGMDARTANYLYPDSILWKTKLV